MIPSMLSVVKLSGKSYDQASLEPLKHLDRLFRLGINLKKFEDAKCESNNVLTADLNEKLQALHIARDGYESDALVAEIQKFDSAQHTPGYATVDSNEKTGALEPVNRSSHEILHNEYKEVDETIVMSASSANNCLSHESDAVGNQLAIYQSNFNLISGRLAKAVKEPEYEALMQKKLSDLVDHETLSQGIGELAKSNLRLKELLEYSEQEVRSYTPNPNYESQMRSLKSLLKKLAQKMRQNFFIKNNIASSTLYRTTYANSNKYDFSLILFDEESD